MVNIKKAYYEGGEYDGHTVYIITSDGEEFLFQLDNNADFKTSMNCLVYKNGEEFDSWDDEGISETEAKLLIDTAERVGYEAMFEKWEDKEFLFRCSYNNTSIYYQVCKESLVARIVSKDHYNNDYCVSFGVLKEFDNEDELLEYAEGFYTDDYHDCKGLYNMLEDMD